ncbi:MAG: hypothetical protein ACYTF2_11665 [Planctomycetota bacterium]|jgi:hypothetical protein
MGKARHKAGARKQTARAPARRRGAPDGAVYIGLIMIGAFGIWLWTIVAPGPEAWKHALLVYVVLVLALINLYTWRVYFGARLINWQKSLARLSLRWAGFGTSGGRPLAAAHGSRRARIMLMLTMVTSIVIIVALAWLLFKR